MARSSVDRPDIHYDNVTEAWRHLLGESLHYGYFDDAARELESATAGLTRLMAERGSLESGQRVLDVGCGVGEPASFLAGVIGCRVTGISTSAVGVEIARERSRALGLEGRLAFEVRDGMANEFDDGSFDRVWVMESSHLMPDKAALIRDSARVLVPGGRFVLCDIIMHRDLPIADVLKRAKAFDLLRKVFGRAKMETLERYRGWCEEAGLTVDGLEDVSRETAPTFDCWKANADRHRGEVVALIGEQAWSDFRDSCDVLRTMWQDGVLGYGVVHASK